MTTGDPPLPDMVFNEYPNVVFTPRPLAYATRETWDRAVEETKRAAVVERMAKAIHGAVSKSRSKKALMWCALQGEERRHYLALAEAAYDAL